MLNKWTKKLKKNNTKCTKPKRQMGLRKSGSGYVSVDRQCNGERCSAT